MRSVAITRAPWVAVCSKRKRISGGRESNPLPNLEVMMNARKLMVATLAGWLVSTQSAWANFVSMPVDDGGMLALSVLGLAAVIKIARGKNRR